MEIGYSGKLLTWYSKIIFLNVIFDLYFNNHFSPTTLNLVSAAVNCTKFSLYHSSRLLVIFFIIVDIRIYPSVDNATLIYSPKQWLLHWLFFNSFSCYHAFSFSLTSHYLRVSKSSFAVHKDICGVYSASKPFVINSQPQSEWADKTCNYFNRTIIGLIIFYFKTYYIEG